MDEHMQIAGRPSIGARIALSRHSHALAIFDARRDCDANFLLFLYNTDATAVRAWVFYNCAFAMTDRAWLRNREKARAAPNLACAFAH